MNHFKLPNAVIITLAVLPAPHPMVTDVTNWCRATCIDKWDWEYGISSRSELNFYFNNNCDATMFRLRWA